MEFFSLMPPEGNSNTQIHHSDYSWLWFVLFTVKWIWWKIVLLTLLMEHLFAFYLCVADAGMIFQAAAFHIIIYLFIYRPVHLQNRHRSLGFLTALLATLRNSIWNIFYISNMLLIAIQSHKLIVCIEVECAFCSVITAKSLRYKLLQIFLHTGWFCRLALTDRWYAAYWDKHQSNTQTLSAKPQKNQYHHLFGNDKNNPQMDRQKRQWTIWPSVCVRGVCVCVCVSSKSYASLSSPAGDLA